jgi:hypothetical protein
VKALVVQYHDNNGLVGNHKSRTAVFTTGAQSHQSLKSEFITVKFVQRRHSHQNRINGYKVLPMEVIALLPTMKMW